MKRNNKGKKLAKTHIATFAAKEAVSLGGFVIDELFGLVNHTVDEVTGSKHKKHK